MKNQILTTRSQWLLSIGNFLQCRFSTCSLVMFLCALGVIIFINTGCKNPIPPNEDPNSKGCKFSLSYSFKNWKDPCTYQFNPVFPASNKVISYEWDFGDNTSSSLPNPIHVFPSSGNYNVCLTLVVAHPFIKGKTCSRKVCKKVVVTKCEGCICGIVPNFDFDIEDCVVRFKDLTKENECNKIISWLWDFGDNSPPVAQQNPSHTFLQNGSYLVCLTIVAQTNDGLQYESKYCQNIFIKGCRGCPCPLNPSFSTNIDACAVSFLGSIGQTECYEAVTWLWDFGDSQQAMVQNPNHIYQSNGTYNVCLTVGGFIKNELVCEAKFCQNVQVEGCGCLLSGKVIEVGHLCFGEKTGQIVVEGINGTPPYTYSINGSPIQSNGTFSLLPAGIYHISIKDSKDCKYQMQIILQQQQVQLSGQVTIINQPFCANNSSGTISVSATGGTPPYQYGLNGVFQNSNIFAGLADENYTISILDAWGCITTLPLVLNSLPGVSGQIVLKNDIPCEGKLGNAVIQGVNGAAPYSYSINNGPQQTSGSFNNLPQGAYSVVISDAKGCTNSIGFVINTIPSNGVNAGIDQQICIGSNVQLLANGMGAFLWSPATGLSCTSCPNPIAAPAVTTTYTVIMTDFNNCISQDNITVFVKESNALNISDVVACPGQAVQLNPNPNAGNYYWYPAAGLSCTNCPSPFATVTSNMTYQVTCSVGNCVLNEQVMVSLNGFVNTSITCVLAEGLLISFEANPSGMTSYHWNFGDVSSGNNNTATGQQVQHLFTNPNQVYQVCLTVESICGPYTTCLPVEVKSNCEGETIKGN